MAEGFSCRLDSLYKGLFAIFDQEKKISAVFGHQTRDPYPDAESDLYPDSFEMLDPDPDSINPDLQHCP
jgi:hypothetical protein